MQEEALQGYRLSPQQKHLWGVLRQGGNAAYQTKCAVAIRGPFEGSHLKTAAQMAIARHEILRTTFKCLPGMTIPAQVIEETGAVRWQEDDLSESNEQASLINAFFHEPSPPFDFEHGPFLYLHLIKKSDEERVLIVRLPAISADSAGLRNLIGELSRGYAAAACGKELDGDVAQYADLAEWQNELIEAEEARVGREYWRDRHLERPPTPQLIFEGVPTGASAFEPRVEELELTSPLLDRIESLSCGAETSLEQILLACWQILLWRHAGQPKIEIGTVFDGRRAAEIEDALGLFAKYLPVTCRLEEGLKLSELIEQIDESLRAARARQEYFSWEQFVEPPASTPRAPFFSFCFEAETASPGFLAGDVSFTIFRQYACIDHFKIKLSYIRGSNGPIIEFHYDSELFDSVDIRRLTGRLKTLLESVIDNPEAQIGELEMLTDAERRRLLIEYNSTEAEWPEDKPLLELFLEQTERTPDAVAVAYGDQRLTYHELNERAAKLAHYLRELGVGPEAVVGLYMERSLDMVVSLLATLKSGGAYLPLDPSYPQARLSFMLEDAGVMALLTETHLRSRAPSTGHAPVVCVDAFWELIRQTPTTECETAAAPDNLAYVIYTSGSTGRPKGVMLRRRSLRNYLLWAINHYPVDDGCGAPVHSSLSFDLTITSLFTPLLTGGCVHLLSAEREIEALGADLSARPGYGLVKLTPAHLQLLAEQLKDVDLDGLTRSFVIGGENLPAQTVRWWRERAAGVRLFNEYGPTESVVGCCVYEVGLTAELEEGRANVPIGRPIANTSLYILDRRQTPVAEGIVGELCIGGEGLARGYLNHPELTAERFAPNPYTEEPGARLYRTGDMARHLRDGQIECLGRIDEQVKLRGYRVELGEIEAVICEHPSVSQCAVVVREDEPGLKRLAAYVISKDWYNPPPGAYCLPNGVAVAQQNKNETDYLYREIFERQVYLRHGIEVREGGCVFDVGANIGLFTIFVGEHCPGASVYAFEPIAEVHACLAQNAARYGERVKVFRYGLSDREQEAQFTYYPRFTMMSRREDYSSEGEDKELIKRYLKNERERGVAGSEDLLTHADELLSGHFEGQARHCRLRRLSDVMKEHGVERIDLLKIDAEHSEDAVLRGINDEDWEKIDQIVMETSDVDMSGKHVREMVEKLEKHGYVVEAEEDEYLQATGLYNLYARRAGAQSAPTSALITLRRQAGVGGTTLTAAALRERLKLQLPEYMVPEVFVALEELPLTPNGKLDRQALPAPDRSAYAAHEYAAPVGKVETALARIWADLLHVERVGRHDNFFALGGHSLLMIALIERMRLEGLQVDIRSLFASPTVAALAATVGRNTDLVDVPPNLIPAVCDAITPEMLPLIRLSAAEIERVVSKTPGGAANVQDVYPLAPLQEGILFHHLMSPEGDVYLSPSLLSFDSRARLERFLRGLQEVIDRHDILRTAVLWEELPEPVQVVWRQAPLVVEEVSLDPARGDIAEQLLACFNPRRYRIDVRQAPLMRVYIAPDAPPDSQDEDGRERRWVMLHLLHHLSVDHTTFEVLLQEVQAHLLGRADEATAPPPFRNFVAQARLGVSREEHESFFRAMLGDVDEPTAPYGLIDVQGDGSGVREARREVDAALAGRLRRIARTLGAPAASLCHLAWALVLGRVSGRDDVVFGTVLSGRMHGGEGADRAPGLFMNTLPARIRVGASSVQDCVRQTHTLLAQLLRHEHAPLALAQRCSAVVAPAPLFSSLLNYRYSIAANSLDAAEEKLSMWEGIRFLGSEERTNYPFNMNVDDLGEGFVLSAQAQSPVDPDRICAYLHTALEELVEALENAPATPVCSLEVLSASERHQLLVGWNGAETEYPAAGSGQVMCVHGLFEAQVEKTAEAIALVYEERSLTYGELNGRANRLAHHLRGLGAGPEARVAICLERSLEMVVALLATLKAGAAYVPLDPDYPPERLAYMLEDSAPAVLLTRGEANSALAGRLPAIPMLDLERDDAKWAGQSEQNPEPSDAGLDARSLAYIIYTSGSTGLPKGAMNEHGGALNRLLWMQEAYGLGPRDAVLQKTPFSFDVSVWEFFWPLLNGARLVMARPGGHKDPGYLASIIREQEISTLHFVPSMLQVFLEGAEASDCRELARVVCSGESLPASLTRLFYERLPETELHNLYGPTEAAVDVTAWDCRDNTTCNGIPIGRPVANTSIYILDVAGRPTPTGVTGGLYIGGAQVGRGYHQRPEMTAERFLPDPFSREPGGRIYQTGDLGRWLPEGAIEFIGRDDFQVKIRGYRIELGEIESVLGEDPRVRECVVTARMDESGNGYLVAYLVCHKVAESPVGELRNALRKRLPDYMVPSAFVTLETLPLTPNGKVDRRALPVPEMSGSEKRGRLIEPWSPVEEIVAGIFEHVLKVEEVGILDNFFEFGGHSLLATRVISRVRNTFGVELSMKSIFESATVESLSRRIEEAMDRGEKEQAPPLVRVSREGQRGVRAPLSFAQQRLWFIEQIGRSKAAYNIPGAVRLEGDLNIEALERSVNEIVRRHEVLRTRIEVEAGEPAQVIDAWEPRRLEVEDLTILPPEERKEEVGRRARAEAETGFDLSRGPLLRVKVLKLEKAEHVALYTMHHIVSDGWSMGILIGEVAALYRAYSMDSVGDEAPLPELEIQYADFAVWQRAWLQGEALEAQLEYWRRQLHGMETLELPTDRPRPAAPSHRGAVQPFVLEREVAERLKELTQREGVTLFMILLGGFGLLMSRYSGQRDVAIGTDIANRNRAEIEGLIGFFVNQLVLRVEVREKESFSESLKRVRETCLGAYAHQDLPFEKLVEELQPERDLSRSPLFQAKLILQNAPGESLELGGLRLSSIGGAEAQARMDLSVSITEVGADTVRGLVGAVTYSRDLFEEQTIERLAQHYTNLLRGIVEHEKPISELSLLSEQEIEQMVVEWNQTRRSYPQNRLIQELFREQAERNPEQIALVCDDQQLSYRELNRRANQIGRYLQGLGVEPETVVGVCLGRSVEMIVALMGALKAGGAFLPLDPESPPERLGYMLEDAGVGVVLTQRGAERRLPVFWGQTVCLDVEWERIDQESECEPESRVEAENLAYVIYTSGSTGRPKGVMVRHRSLVNYTLDICRQLGLVEGSDRRLQFATVSTITADLGNTCIYPSLVSGGCLHVLSYETATDGARYEEYLRREPINVLKIVPSHLGALLGSQPRGVKLLPSRYLILGGEAFSFELAEQIKERSEGCEVINHYGPTETTVGSLTERVKDEEERRNGGSVPIGRPIANTEGYVLDRELKPAPIRVKGELYIGGEGVARGYWNRPDLTAERFIPNLFGRQEGGRLYRTGDVVRHLSDGKIEFLGRADDQVKVRGYRVELGEIEAALRGHPGVREAIVLAREDSPGDKRLVAYYTEARAENPVDPESLRAHLSISLPEYMAPVAYIAMEEMPLTPNGKLDRRALPAPNGAGFNIREYEAPIGAIEVSLARIWAEALGLERVGRHDSFFDLGGYSLLAVKVASRMREEGLHVDVAAFFTAPTLASLAATVGDNNGIVEVPPNRIPPDCDAIYPEMLPLVQLNGSDLERIVSAVIGGAANVQDIYPLAPLQEGILFHHLMVTEGDPYLGYHLYSFDTRDRVDKFLRALQTVIDRHDILRTAVHWEGLPEPVQVVWRQASAHVEEVSFDPAAGDIAEQLLARFNPRHCRIDIRQAPLVRVCLTHDMVNERWIMLCLLHHLIDDVTSLSNLVREIHAHMVGREEQLPPPLPLRNFVAQARLGVSWQEHESFFRAMLGDVDEPTTPFGLINIQGDGTHISEARREVDARLGIRLRQRAKALGVTAAGLYHLAWAMVLARASGRDDVVFGTVLFGRMQGAAGADRVLGLFINTLPVRIRFGDSSAQESIRRTHALLAQLMRHEHAPLSLAQRCSGVMAPAPLFSSFLNYRHNATTDLSSQEAQKAWEGIRKLGGAERTTYPLCLNVDDLGDGFDLNVQVESPVDPDRICAYMHAALEQLVESLEQAPATPVRSLEVLPASERHQLLVEWNGAEIEYPQETCVHELFESQVKKAPEAIALFYEDQSLTYSELNGRANRLAWRLREMGVGPEARVAICLERSIEMVVALLATLKAGGAYVPLDPDYPAERLAYMLEDSSPAVLLTLGAANSSLRGLLPLITTLDLESDQAQWACHSEQNPEHSEAGSDARSLAYIIYTSGSTGRPKGAMNEHRGALNRLLWMQDTYGLGSRDAVLQKTPFSFDVSVWEFFWPLLSGARLVMARPGGHKDPEYLAQIIREQEISTLHFVPSMLQTFLEHPEAGSCRELARVVCSGETLPASLTGRFYERLPESELHNLYGPTEAAVDVTAWNCKEKTTCVGIPIGRPVANTSIYILDVAGQPAPVGVAGGLYIGGAQVGRGYYQRPEMTAERFLPDPFGGQPGGRVYQTGDVGRWLREGAIDFLGRNDLQVKIRGYRIELGEIEARLTSHPGVSEAVVIAREEKEAGKRLVAYYTGEEVAAEALRVHLSSGLPSYMVPAAYVRLESLPLTPNGKLDRRALPAPDMRMAEDRDGYLALWTPVEEIVVGIFGEALELDRVGIHDNFFEIGGHSLLATRVISRVRDRFRVEIGVRSVFEEPTAEGLGRRIEWAMRAGEKAESPPLVRVERDGQGVARAPLSFAQQRLWFLDQLTPNNPIYNISGAVRLEGALNLEALERAINEIVRRHESLRTRFDLVEGEPSQVIEEWEPRRLDVLDLKSAPPEERAEEVGRRAREEAGTGFDLSRGPLFRVKVLKLAEEEYALLYTMSHIVSDEWSTGILIREVGALYRAYSAGEAAPLPELEIQYADFAVWQRAYLAGEALEREVNYWRAQLKDAAMLELPADRPRPAEPSYRGGLESVEIGEEIQSGLRRLSQREGATLFMVLMAAFKALLMRYSRQEDVSVGTVIANRTRREVEGLIGFFVNTLVMRTDLSGNPSFRELIRREREVALGAYAHQDLPFEKLVEEINPERGLSQSPLFQVMMRLQHVGRETLELPGVKLKIIGAEVEKGGDGQSAKFDLTLSIMDLGMDLGADLGRELAGAVEYSRDLFEAGTIERLINHFINVLKGVVEDSERPIGSLDLLSEGERKQIVEEWNATETHYPAAGSRQEKLLHELFEEQSGSSPDAVALVCEEQRLTYSELNAQANRLANYLRGLGVGPESRVAILLERSVELVIAELAALKCGAAYVPLDRNAPSRRQAMMIEDCQAEVVLTVEREEVPAVAGVRRVDLDGMAASEEKLPNLGFEVGSETAAYIIYTSGSTGQPKGVVIPHRAIGRLVINNGYAEFESEDRVGFTSNPAFDASTMEVWAPLLHGGCLVVISEEVLLNAKALAELLRQEEVSVLHLVAGLLSAHGVQLASSYTRLKYLLTGGDVVDTRMVAKIMDGGPPRRLIHCYGPSESTTFATTYEVRGVPERTKRLPIGRPIAETRIYISDKWREPAPISVAGEIYIGGAGVARGYLNRPELTAERFLPDPFSHEPGERVYMTGDLGRWLPEGNIEFLGRNDLQVKIRGYRIELGEIEARLTIHPGVSEAVVIAQEKNGTDKRLIAYYTGEEVAAEALRVHLSSGLPSYMVPAAYVRLESLPLTPNGKLDRRALPAPDMRMADDSDGYLAPRTAVGEIVVGIFKEVLKLDRVSIHDNFFEIGGHSLLATQVISRVRDTFGVEIGVRSVFEEPTAEGLARNIEEAMIAGEKEKAPPLVRVSRGERAPLSFAQQRLWFIDRLDPGNAAYNIPGAVRLEGVLNIEALERVINEVVRRHEVLRTRIEVDDGEPMQVIDAWKPRRLEVIDLTILPPEEREAEVERRVREEAGTGFDLSRGPLLRVKVLKLEEEEHVLLYTMSHIASDGWSTGILIREVGALYGAYCNGETAQLPELPIQYADFARWQRSWLHGEALENQLAYWRRQLGAELPALELPTDKPRPAIQTRRGAARSHMLPVALSDSLKSLSLKQSCTLFMTLLAAFKTLLYYLTGQTDICIGTDIANRNRAEIENLIGFFVNQLVLRAELSPSSTFEELLRKVREITLAAYGRQDLPFEKLVETINPKRDANRTPLFQVKMVLQNASSEELRLPGLKLSSIAVATGVAKFDLLLNLTDSERGLSASLQYDADLFEERASISILNRFHTLLDRIVERPDARLQELVESLIEEDKREEQEKKNELKDVRRRKLKRVKRRAIDETYAETEK